MSNTVDSQTQTMIDNVPEKTGKPLEAWFQILHESGFQKHGEMMKLMKESYGVSHGFANLIALLYRQKEAGGKPPEEDLVAVQYAGAKEGLLPLYDAVIDAARSFGTDVEIAPKKNYVSLRRSKQFAIVQPSTRTRVDLGLNLKDYPPTDRLEQGNIFNGMCTHLVKLESVEDLDQEVVSWLRAAYDQA
ncbi:MAG TPA: DUF4287 domain-containing protein [Clostridiaceae bacterium]|nr:DUF4287 domain-containing protein [Clostridiaceae bacterium]